MCNVIQLELDFAPQLGASLDDDVRAFDVAATRQGLASFLYDPCKGCDLAEWCGHDDCAHKLYDIDVLNPDLD